MNRTKTIHPSERGASLVELAIVAPAMMLLVFAAFSLCGQLRGSQHASSMSRELASMAYRDCLADAQAGQSDKFSPDSCLPTAVETFRAANEFIKSDMAYVVTLYNYDTATDTAKLTFQAATPGQTSRVSLTSFAGTDPYGTALMASLRTLNRLIIAEVFYPEDGRIVYAATII
ncbi:MAG: TadE family protein [Bdellovibrionota bacterium]